MGDGATTENTAAGRYGVVIRGEVVNWSRDQFRAPNDEAAIRLVRERIKARTDYKTTDPLHDHGVEAVNYQLFSHEDYVEGPLHKGWRDRSIRVFRVIYGPESDQVDIAETTDVAGAPSDFQRVGRPDAVTAHRFLTPRAENAAKARSGARRPKGGRQTRAL